jgi:TrmH family RNA methyltransferase
VEIGHIPGAAMSELQQANLRVVLIEPRNPLNIGAAARAMSNFGFLDLRLVKPYDVAFREAVSGVGAGHLMKRAHVYETLAEALAGVSLVVGATGIGHRQFHHPLYRLERGGRMLKRHLAAAPAALLFGSEKFGLSNDDLSYCHYLVHIPTRAEHDSMNLGQAVALCLYELARAPMAARQLPGAAELAPGEDVERFTQLLLEMLEESGYSDFSSGPSSVEKARRLVRRLALRSGDVNLWIGILRQALWRMRRTSAPHEENPQSSQPDTPMD